MVYVDPPADANIACYTVRGGLTWHTYYGGTGDDAATAIATNGVDSIDVAGYTYSDDLPTGTYLNNVIEPEGVYDLDIYID